MEAEYGSDNLINPIHAIHHLQLPISYTNSIGHGVNLYSCLAHLGKI
jgi:hypothetical protein